MRRYNPKTQRLTILEFGNKFFTKNGKILTDEIDMRTQYPLGWDDLHDRDVVWTTTPNMIDDFIQGIEDFTVINPFCILDLGSNIKTLDKVENRMDITYWEEQRKNNDFFVFVGKNRTLTAIYKVWLSMVMGESTYDRIKDYVIEYKLFDKNFTLQWKGEIYRGEKTQYPDSEIMMLVSYPCQIGNRQKEIQIENRVPRRCARKPQVPPAAVCSSEPCPSRPRRRASRRSHSFL